MEWSDGELERVVAKLREIHERSRPPEPPGARTEALRPDATPYERAQHELGTREHQLSALADLGEILIGEMLPPPAQAGEDEELVRVLRSLQEALFRHPLAFRAGYAALVEEGRRFAQTEEGAEWLERLRHSPLLPRVRLFGKMLSFSMLEQDDPERLPSTYLEGLFRLAGHPDADAVLDRLFGSGNADG